jgi:hypothetical protein
VIETAGVVEVHDERILVTLDKRCHNPLLREARLDQDGPPIPWLGQRRLAFAYQ